MVSNGSLILDISWCCPKLRIDTQFFRSFNTRTWFQPCGGTGYFTQTHIRPIQNLICGTPNLFGNKHRQTHNFFWRWVRKNLGQYEKISIFQCRSCSYCLRSYFIPKIPKTMKKALGAWKQPPLAWLGRVSYMGMGQKLSILGGRNIYLQYQLFWGELKRGTR